MGDIHKGEYEDRRNALYGSHQLAQQQALGFGQAGALQGLASGLFAGQAALGGLYNGRGEKVKEKPKTYKEELQEEIDEWLSDI